MGVGGRSVCCCGCRGVGRFVVVDVGGGGEVGLLLWVPFC